MYHCLLLQTSQDSTNLPTLTRSAYYCNGKFYLVFTDTACWCHYYNDEFWYPSHTKYSYISYGLAAFLSNLSYTHVHLLWANLDTTLVTLFFFLHVNVLLLSLGTCCQLSVATSCRHCWIWKTWEQPFLLFNVGYPTATVRYVAGCNIQLSWLPCTCAATSFVVTGGYLLRTWSTATLGVFLWRGCCCVSKHRISTI